MELDKINFPQKGIYWIHEKLSEKQFLIFSSVLVGLSAGLAAVILKLFVNFIKVYVLEDWLLNYNFKYVYLGLPLIGIGLTVFIIQYFFKGKFSRGTVNILHAIAKKGSFLPFRQIYSHIITSGLTVGFGGSAGLESPIVSTGAALGSNYAKRYKLSYKERTMLLAAGAAGGIAGAFNAPIAGVLFALEVVLVDISITAFIPLLIAAASGALLSKIILNESILLVFQTRQPFDYLNVPYYLVLGLLVGVTSLYYVNVFEKIETKFKTVKSKYLRWIIGSVLLAVLFAFFPSLFGEGYNSIKTLSHIEPELLVKNSIIGSYITNQWLILLFITGVMLFKAFAVGITIGSGGNGGNFAPALFVGAYTGFIYSYFLMIIGFHYVPISNFTLVAMAGLLSGVFHAPLTAIFLIAEITGGYELMIPLMLVSSISYTIVKYFHPVSLDVKKLMKKGTFISEDKDISILGKIETKEMIETNFSVIHFKTTLREIVEIIKHSKRNSFPVVNKFNKFLGIIQLDNIREEMFNQELYDKVIAKELMNKPIAIINLEDDIFKIMKKFEESGQWNLPVVDKGHYVGFLSKSSILTKYRNELLASV